jgi:hypothetical protein
VVIWLNGQEIYPHAGAGARGPAFDQDDAWASPRKGTDALVQKMMKDPRRFRSSRYPRLRLHNRLDSWRVVGTRLSGAD